MRNRTVLAKAAKAAKRGEVPAHGSAKLNVKSGRSADWSRRDQRYQTGRFEFTTMGEPK